MRMDCRLTVVFAGQIRSKAFIRKYAIKRLTPLNANPDLVDAYLALFRHQHNGEVSHWKSSSQCNRAQLRSHPFSGW